jgi:hypothetical protein
MVPDFGCTVIALPAAPGRAALRKAASARCRNRAVAARGATIRTPQRRRGRDDNAGRPLSDLFDGCGRPAPATPCTDREGRTVRQKNLARPTPAPSHRESPDRPLGKPRPITIRSRLQTLIGVPGGWKIGRVG